MLELILWIILFAWNLVNTVKLGIDKKNGWMLLSAFATACSAAAIAINISKH